MTDIKNPDPVFLAKSRCTYILSTAIPCILLNSRCTPEFMLNNVILTHIWPNQMDIICSCFVATKFLEEAEVLPVFGACVQPEGMIELECSTAMYIVTALLLTALNLYN